MSHMPRKTPPPWTAQARIDTPLGEMLLARTAGGLAGAWFAGQKHHPPRQDAPVRPDDALLAQAARQLQAYFSGGSSRFTLALDPQGTMFQKAVWRALIRIAPGHRCSYGQLAQTLGAPQAARAVGAAVGRNPLSIIVPCHRVLGASGALTGYAGGLDRKRALLALEAGALPAPMFL